MNKIKFMEWKFNEQYSLSDLPINFPNDFIYKLMSSWIFFIIKCIMAGMCIMVHFMEVDVN